MSQRIPMVKIWLQSQNRTNVQQASKADINDATVTINSMSSSESDSCSGSDDSEEEIQEEIMFPEFRE